MSKRYLGDGAYVDFDGFGLVLTTENGISTTNRIVLEPGVYFALVAYVDDIRSGGNDNMARNIYKIEAQGDTVYIQAADEDGAVAALASKLGPIPRSMLTVTLVDALPDGEEFL